jgi:hypothetical protein
MSDRVDEISEAITDFEDEYGIELADDQFNALGQLVAARADETGEIDVEGVYADATGTDAVDDLQDGIDDMRDWMVSNSHDEGAAHEWEVGEHEAGIANIERKIGRPLTGGERDKLWELPAGSDRDDVEAAFDGPTSRDIATNDAARQAHVADVIDDMDAERREEAEERGEEIPEDPRYFTTPTEQALTKALETPTDG